MLYWTQYALLLFRFLSYIHPSLSFNITSKVIDIKMLYTSLSQTAVHVPLVAHVLHLGTQGQLSY